MTLVAFYTKPLVMWMTAHTVASLEPDMCSLTSKAAIVSPVVCKGMANLAYAVDRTFAVSKGVRACGCSKLDRFITSFTGPRYL